jgi:FkbM family methyltransferase
MSGFKSISRVVRRRLLRKARRFVKSPDAWGDIIDILNANPEALFLDIGAHTGGTVQRIHDECANRIVAFEPTESSRLEIERTFAQSPRVSVEPVALADVCGTASLHLNANTQTNSLLENAKGNLDSFPDDVRHLSQTEVDTLTLDAWRARHPVTAPLFLKIDVQGSELAVLQGALESLEQAIAVYAECPLAPMYENQGDFWQIHEMLLSRGFVLSQIYPCLKDRTGRACQTDALWIRLPES